MSDYSQFTAISRVSFDIQETGFYVVVIIHTKAARIGFVQEMCRYVI